MELCPQKIIDEFAFSVVLVPLADSLVLENQVYRVMRQRQIVSKETPRAAPTAFNHKRIGQERHSPSSHLLFTANVPGAVVLTPTPLFGP